MGDGSPGAGEVGSEDGLPVGDGSGLGSSVTEDEGTGSLGSTVGSGDVGSGDGSSVGEGPGVVGSGDGSSVGDGPGVVGSGDGSSVTDGDGTGTTARNDTAVRAVAPACTADRFTGFSEKSPSHSNPAGASGRWNVTTQSSLRHTVSSKDTRPVVLPAATRTSASVVPEDLHTI